MWEYIIGLCISTLTGRMIIDTGNPVLDWVSAFLISVSTYLLSMFLKYIITKFKNKIKKDPELTEEEKEEILEKPDLKDDEKNEDSNKN